MKILKLRELSLDELRARGRELKQEALQMRIQKASGQLENKNGLKTLRKENARIETILSERRLGLVLNTGKDAVGSVKTKPAKISQSTPAATKKTAVKPSIKKAAVKKPSVKKQAE